MIIWVIHSRLRQSVTQQAQAGRQAGREDASDGYKKNLISPRQKTYLFSHQIPASVCAMLLFKSTHSASLAV